MNQHLPDPIRNLAQLFRKLPGVGPKTALRFVFALLAAPGEESERLARSLMTLRSQVKTCGRCGSFTMGNPCEICRDERRDPSILCIVAESRDIATIEATGQFQGYYFVLGGLLSPLEGTTPAELRTTALINRINETPALRELVLGFSSDLRGESTILYLSKLLLNYSLRLTTLARGLPLGTDLEYADEVTLGDALRERRLIPQTQTHQTIDH